MTERAARSSAMGERAAPGGGGGRSSVWLEKSGAGYMTHDEASRRAADRRSNLTGAAPLPDWADNGTEYIATGTSIFDPVLCEALYSWFSRPGAAALDPFAGGSVRGIVAGMLGRSYVGVDLSAAQVEANRAQGAAICAGPAYAGAGEAVAPTWHVGDARNICADWPEAGRTFDMVLTCPPYFDLEVYSDDPADLSRAPDREAFGTALAEILTACAARLADDRFVAVVMGEARDDDGQLYGLVPATIAAAHAAGLAYWNEAVLITMVGSLPLRINAAFTGSRKMGRTHQSVLVFVKGDARRATEWCGPVDVPSLEALISGGTLTPEEVAAL